MNLAKRLVVVTSLLLVCATASWGQAPVIEGPFVVTGYVGVAFSHQVVALNSPTAYTASGLPSGLALNTDYGTIAGTPQTVGTYPVALGASNGSGPAISQTLTIVILAATPAPVITSALSVNGVVGVSFSYQIVATNATSYNATPLPVGLSVDTVSGLISGTPEVSGSMNVTLAATNTFGTDTKTLALTIQPASVAYTTNVIFSEGFETNFPSGWQVGDANASGTPAYWAAVSSPFGGVTAPDGSRMGYCAGVGYGGTSASPAYQNNMTAYLQRTFDLSGSSAVTLTFRSRIPGIETGFDSCRVRISTDSGSKWTDVWNVSRVDGSWTSETVALNAYAGNSAVTIRFEFDSDASVTGLGWFLDDIVLRTAQGDRFDNATVISCGTNYAGTVAAANVLDVTRVTLRQGYTYVITATAGALADPQMWLFDPNRIQLAYNDDASGLGLSSRITCTCTATGDYFVQVGGVSGGTGSYTLLVAEQSAYADIQAVSVAMTLPDDGSDPRGQNPATLDYTLQNNGPMSLDNGETYNYEVDAYLSTNGASVGAGEWIGSETIQLAIASNASAVGREVGDATSYIIPADLPAGDYYVWLHVMPLGGSPTDSKLANNWVAGETVYLPPPATVTIAGIVTKSGGLSGAPGVTILLLSDDGSTTNTITDSYGNYSVAVSNGWTGTIAPSTNSVTGVSTPAVRAYADAVTNNLVSQNFGLGPTLTISGKVSKSGASTTGVAGVMIVFSGIGTAIAASNGNYTMTVPLGWSGTATASFTNGGFATPTKSYSAVSVNKTAQNFVWSPSPVISGKVTKSGASTTGVAGVPIAFSGGAGTATTDSSGSYSNTVPYKWSGTATASFTNGGFAAPVKTYSAVTASKTAQNFVWSPSPVVSGKVTITGTKVAATNVVIAFSGIGTAATAADGSYAMTVPYNWTGTATLFSAGTFVPVKRTFSKVIANKTGQNFTWTAPASLVQPRPLAVAALVPAAAAAGAAPRQLLHTTGRVRWTGEDAVLAQQSPELLILALVDGVVKVEPAVPVVASGDLATELEFVDGLAGIVGTANCDLVVVRNIDGKAMTDAVLTGTAVLDAVVFRTPGSDAVLTWDLLLLRP